MFEIKDSNYQQFSTQERVSLTLAALSRGDSEEARRLYKTCPKYNYLATDYDFTRRIDAITWVGEKYVELCQYFYDKALLLEASILAVILASEALEDKMAFSKLDMEEARVGHIRTLKAVHLGLMDFCEEVGIDSAQLVLWMSPPEGRAGINEYLSMDGIEPDEEFAGHIKNKFLAHWESYCSLR